MPTKTKQRKIEKEVDNGGDRERDIENIEKKIEKEVDSGDGEEVIKNIEKK